VSGTIYVRTQEPASEPVAVADVCTFLRIDDAEAVADIQNRIARARAYIEDMTGRAIISQTWKLFLTEWPRGCTQQERALIIIRPPVVSVESVKYYPADGSAQTTLDQAVYGAFVGVEPACLYLKSGQVWPAVAQRPDAIEVSFTAGAEDSTTVSPTIVSAILIKIKEEHDGLSDPEIRALENLIEMNRAGGFVA
jgi:uncharacterized phiE125 gp8 family phage protein